MVEELVGLLVHADHAATTSYYPFTDQVDSVRTLVTATGAVAATYTYSAYGITRTTTGSLTQPYQYGGGHTDAATGLIKLGIRYYDTTHGRFTQPDPTGQEPHDYLYVNADPITLNDPNGDIAPLIVIGIGIGARAAAPHIARAAVKYAPKAISYIKNGNNAVRVGNGRISIGPAKNHWQRMSPTMQSVARHHIHISKRYGGIDNWVKNTNRTWWPRKR